MKKGVVPKYETRLDVSVNCGTRPPTQTHLPPPYPLNELATANAPRNIAALQNWLGRRWDGKIYVARTIWGDGNEFSQGGCSPNYMAGWWTLACCMHRMRSGSPFKWKISEGKIPIYVFTLASMSRETRMQALVSVAKITWCFDRMEQYADFLLKSKNEDLKFSRLSREKRNDKFKGWHFGDCHANALGKVGTPKQGHLHHCDDRDNRWKLDCPEISGSLKHLILISDKFIVWRRPFFKASHVFTHSAYGTNINDDNLEKYIQEA